MTLRVLHVIYDDTGNPWVAGGGAVRVHELYRRLAGRVDVTVLTGRYPGAADREVDGVRYVHLGAARPYAWSRLTFARAANARLRRGAYDAAVFDFSTYTPVFVPRDRPVGITVHHVSGPTARERWGRGLGAALERVETRMLRRARVFSATSAATAAALRRVVARDATIHLVHAGVDDELFTVPRRDEGYLLYFGRLDVFQKGLDTLLEAFALLRARRPQLRLRVAGRGKDAPRVAELAASLGVADAVELLGPVDEARRRELFAGAAVQLMPSRFEGFGMVAAEAMAAGVSLVATAVDSLPEVVSPPDGGVLVPPGDALRLADAVDALLADPGARRRLGESARRSAERFRWDHVAERHLEFVREVADGTPVPREA